MAEPSSEKRKRRRVNPTHRWTDGQTTELLEAVLDEVKDNPEQRYEKPTGQRFYARICEKVPSVRTLTWYVLKNKMRNLKTSYVAAVSWKKQAGDALQAEGHDRDVREYILKICPFWDLLEQIFGDRIAAYIEARQMEFDDFENDLDASDIDHVDLYSNLITDTTIAVKTEFHEDQTDSDKNPADLDYMAERSKTSIDYTPEPSTTSNSGTDFTPYKNQLNKNTSKTNQPTPNSTSISLLVSMQEKKLKFEEMKWEKQVELDSQKLELDKEKLCFARDEKVNELEIKKIELQHQLEIRKLEIERDERVALTKIKLEIEAEERIKKYELDLKLKK